MSEWFFEKNGERGGPVSADELKVMVSSGAISLTNLVWTAAFGSEWKRLGDTELAPPRPVLPPPLPNKEPPALPPKPDQPASEPNDFLNSELTKALIGKKQDYYLGKWRPILAKAGTDPKKLATASSWNWPALFLPYGWLLYRKLYVLGGMLLAVQLAYVLLPDSVPTSLARAFLFATFGIAIMTALYGNAWYLDAVHRRWERLRQEPDQAATLAKAKEAGGINLAAPIAAFILVIAAAVAPHLNLIGWGDPVALVRDGYMTDYPGTTVGKAFAGNFDNGSWRSFTTPKGQKVVEFTGKINAALHANATTSISSVLIEGAEKARKSGRSKVEADALELNYLASLFQAAYKDLKGQQALQKLQQKWGCPSIIEANPGVAYSGSLPNCAEEHLSSFLNDAIGEWVDQSQWPVGGPVTVQWTIRVDGEGFDLTHLSSKAWDGKEQDHILAILFQ